MPSQNRYLYICKKCNASFKYHSWWQRHQIRKTPCKSNSQRIFYCSDLNRLPEDFSSIPNFSSIPELDEDILPPINNTFSSYMCNLITNNLSSDDCSLSTDTSLSNVNCSLSNDNCSLTNDDSTSSYIDSTLTNVNCSLTNDDCSLTTNSLSEVTESLHSSISNLFNSIKSLTTRLNSILA